MRTTTHELDAHLWASTNIFTEDAWRLMDEKAVQ